MTVKLEIRKVNEFRPVEMSIVGIIGKDTNIEQLNYEIDRTEEMLVACGFTISADPDTGEIIYIRE
jgi:hypothetical protein